MLTCGVIGLPTVGKTTLFNLLTGCEAETCQVFSGKSRSNAGIANIPDPRIDFLSEMYAPEKTTYAQLEVADVPGLVRGSSQGEGVGNKFLDGIRKCDALVHTVRAFKNDKVLHVDDNINPLRDIDTVSTELILADLQVIENRLARLSSSKKLTTESQREMKLLAEIQETLEEGAVVSNLRLSEDEVSSLRSLGFLTEKPMLMVVNLDEEQFANGTYPGASELRQVCTERNLPLLEICCQLEMEISQVSVEDRKALLGEYGIEETGISRLARAVYGRLGLISFFTVGKDEVRAWTVEEGSNARIAAGKIHSDIARGFIKAEVVRYDDLVRLGKMTSVKEKGLFRLEGKEYIVKDSDIISFRFNVS